MDEFIVRQLKNLRKVRPSASLLLRQRSFLLSEISRQEQKTKQVSETKRRFFIFPVFNFSKLLKPVYAVAFILIILASSLGTVSIISAAQNSLPGDSLYVLKTAFEHTQMTLAANQEIKAQLSIKFANLRIDEFTQVVNKPEKKQDIENTIKNLTQQLVSVQENMNILKEKNSEKAAEIAKIINQQTSVYAETLIRTSEQLADIMPGETEKIKSEIDQALIEVNKTRQKAEEMIKAGENQETNSDILVPTEEEQPQSSSIPFEKINE